MAAKEILIKVLHFPLTKIIMGLIVCAGLVMIPQFLIKNLLSFLNIEKDFGGLISATSLAILTVLSYVYLFKYYEKREISEFSLSGIARSLISGLALGAILQALTIFVIFIKGGYSVVSINPFSYIVPPLAMAITTAICEETLVRGIVFRIMEEKLGSYLSLVISAILFGALHLQNPNSSMVAGLGLAVQAGLLLAAAFIYARNLWFPIAIHFAWNFTQSAIFGANVSGMSTGKTLVTSEIHGADLLTGGQFGPEGSIQATLFCLVATVVLLYLSRRNGQIIKPSWKRSN